MGLFDSIAKYAASSFIGEKQINMLHELLNEGGGLPGVQAKFDQAGLKDVFASWVSTGPNLPMTAKEMEGAMGPEHMQKLTAKVGMDAGTVLPLLAQYFPQIIDALTPKGVIDNPHPSKDDLKGALDRVMKSGLGSFFGR